MKAYNNKLNYQKAEGKVLKLCITYMILVITEEGNIEEGGRNRREVKRTGSCLSF